MWFLIEYKVFLKNLLCRIVTIIFYALAIKNTLYIDNNSKRKDTD